MKINKSITITDLPGGMTLKKVVDGYLFERFPDRTLTAEDLTEVRDAINLMLEEEPETAKSSTVNGPWDRLDDIPSDVGVVIDRVGDRAWMEGFQDWDQEARTAWDRRYAPYRLPEPGELAESGE